MTCDMPNCPAPVDYEGDYCTEHLLPDESEPTVVDRDVITVLTEMACASTEPRALLAMLFTILVWGVGPVLLRSLSLEPCVYGADFAAAADAMWGGAFLGLDWGEWIALVAMASTLGESQVPLWEPLLVLVTPSSVRLFVPGRLPCTATSGPARLRVTVRSSSPVRDPPRRVSASSAGIAASQVSTSVG